MAQRASVIGAAWARRAAEKGRAVSAFQNGDSRGAWKSLSSSAPPESGARLKPAEGRTMAKGSGGGTRARHRRRDVRLPRPGFARGLAMAAAGPSRRTPEVKQRRFLSNAAKGPRDA